MPTLDGFTERDTYTMILPMKPTPWKAPRVTRRGTFSPHHRQRQQVQRFLKEAWIYGPLDGPLELEIEYRIKPPPSYSNAKKLRLYGQPHTVKPDATNLNKFLEDCLKKIVIEDDARVYQITGRKLWHTEDEVIINVSKLEYPYK